MATAAYLEGGEVRRCSRCQARKGQAEFYHWKGRLSSMCRSCESAYHAALRRQQRAQAQAEKDGDAGDTVALANQIRELWRVVAEEEYSLESWEALLLFNIELWAIELRAGRRAAVRDLEDAAAHPECSLLIALAAAYAGWEPQDVVSQMRTLVPEVN